MITDTTKKLQNLTNDLCQSDDEFESNNMHNMNGHNGHNQINYNDVISLGDESLNTFLHEASMAVRVNSVLNDEIKTGEAENYAGDSESNNKFETIKDTKSDNNIIGTYRNGSDKVDIKLPNNMADKPFNLNNDEMEVKLGGIDSVDGTSLDLMLQSVDLNGTSL